MSKNKKRSVDIIKVEASIDTDDLSYQIGLLDDNVSLEMIATIDAAKADWCFTEKATLVLLDNFFCPDLEDLKEINPKELYNKCKSFIAQFDEASKK